MMMHSKCWGSGKSNVSSRGKSKVLQEIQSPSGVRNRWRALPQGAKIGIIAGSIAALGMSPHLWWKPFPRASSSSLPSLTFCSNHHLRHLLLLREATSCRPQGARSLVGSGAERSCRTTRIQDADAGWKVWLWLQSCLSRTLIFDLYRKGGWSCLCRQRCGI